MGLVERLTRLLSAWRRASMPIRSVRWLRGWIEPNQRIAALVLEAEASHRLSDPSLVALKSDWLGRFERYFGLVGHARRQLDGEAELRLSRHRAAGAYLKNQVS